MGDGLPSLGDAPSSFEGAPGCEGCAQTKLNGAPSSLGIAFPLEADRPSSFGGAPAYVAGEQTSVNRS
jgi:hypothetical protein